MRILFVFFLVLQCLVITGCGNYIQKMHNQINQESGGKKQRKRSRDKFSFYRDPKLEREAQATSRNLKSLRPKIKRKYTPKPRVKAEDLIDNAADGSLWSGRGQQNFLFAKNRARKNGDIVSVLVQKELKNEISMELKRVFPARKKRKSKDATTDQNGSADTAAAPAETEANETSGDEQIFDRISSVIIEEINKDHLLLRGRKSLLYQRKKHMVEVEVLINRTDISDEDTVYSKNVLESNIHVIR